MRPLTDPSFLPEHIMPALQRYIDHGYQPGSFLTSVLCNDLKGAISNADHMSLAGLPALVSYIYNNCPIECWGSEENMISYMQERRRLDIVDMESERLCETEEEDHTCTCKKAINVHNNVCGKCLLPLGDTNES